MDPLRVMSFNLRYGTAQDGANAWPFRREAAIETIRSFAPSVVGLQEALGFQIEEILAAMPGYAAVGVGRDDGVSEGEFAAIIYDSSRLEPEESGTFWFSPTPNDPGSRHPGCYHPRICTWARFSEGFTLYNLHLDNESEPSRMVAIDQLLALPKKGSVMVTGDFNAGEGDACIEAMRIAGFRDSYRVLHTGPAATYHGFGSEGTEKIDYIWVDESWEVLEAEIVAGQMDGAWPSDHYPVTAATSRSGSSPRTAAPSTPRSG